MSDWRERREDYLLRNARADQLIYETRNDRDEPQYRLRPAPAAAQRFRLKPRVVKVTENHIEQQCLTLLALGGWHVQRNHTGSFKSADGRRWVKGHPKGTPDYTCIKGRNAFMLETKRPGEKASPDQIERHKELRLLFNIEIATVDSVEALNAWLKNFNPDRR